MAHNLNFNDRTGKYPFFSVKEKAWHGLGQVVQDFRQARKRIDTQDSITKCLKNPTFIKGEGLSLGADGEVIEGGDIIFPEFLLFDGTKHRTLRLNSTINLIYHNINKLSNKKRNKSIICRFVPICDRRGAIFEHFCGRFG